MTKQPLNQWILRRNDVPMAWQIRKAREEKKNDMFRKDTGSA